MKTHRLILLTATVILGSIPVSSLAQPARPTSVSERTQSVWQEVQDIAQATSRASSTPVKPEDLGSFEGQIQRLKHAAICLAELKLDQTDAVLADHVRASIAAHRTMAQALHHARHELVPAMQALRTELQTSARVQKLACEQDIDLERIGLHQDFIDFVAMLKDDPALAEESHFLPTQVRLVTEGIASFERAEQRLRTTVAANEQVAIKLGVKYGPEFLAGNRLTTLWAW